MIDLDKLEALEKAATPGPWRLSMSGYSVKSDDPDYPIIVAVRGGAEATARQLGKFIDNGEFVAAARTAVPELCKALREARAERQCPVCKLPFVTPPEALEQEIRGNRYSGGEAWCWGRCGIKEHIRARVLAALAKEPVKP